MAAIVAGAAKSRRIRLPNWTNDNNLRRGEGPRRHTHIKAELPQSDLPGFTEFFMCRTGFDRVLFRVDPVEPSDMGKKWMKTSTERGSLTFHWKWKGRYESHLSNTR